MTWSFKSTSEFRIDGTVSKLDFSTKYPGTDGVIIAIDYLHNITTKLYTYQCDEDEAESVSNEQKTKAKEIWKEGHWTVNQEPCVHTMSLYLAT